MMGIEMMMMIIVMIIVLLLLLPFIIVALKLASGVFIYMYAI